MELILVFILFFAINLFLRRGKDGGGQVEEAGMKISNGIQYRQFININCPYCRISLSIPEEGDWICHQCNQTLVYYKNQIYKSEDIYSIIAIYIMAFLAKFCKIDGVVTNQELKIVADSVRFFIGVNDDEIVGLKKIFNEEMKSPDNYEEILEKIHKVLQANMKLKKNMGMFLIDTMFKIATVDGEIKNIHERHSEIIFKTVQIFNIDLTTYEALKDKYIGVNNANQLDYYYKVLELSNNPTIAEVKEKYRKLSKKYHPDIYASQDLPQEIIDLTAEKFREINEAYEVLINRLSS